VDENTRENTREIEREMADTRARLDVHLRELEFRVTSVSDWRWHYRRHTGAALAIGVCGGFILESFTHRRRPTARRVRYVAAGRSQRVVEPRRRSSWIGNIFEKLIVMASGRALNMVADRFVAGLKSAVEPTARPPAWFPGQPAARAERPHAAVRGA
jgi:hypothetical protein